MRVAQRHTRDGEVTHIARPSEIPHRGSIPLKYMIVQKKICGYTGEKNWNFLEVLDSKYYAIIIITLLAS